MASYHFSATIIGRSAGKTAVGAAAYRSGGVLTCPETGEVFDYSRKGGVVDTFIIAPKNAPDHLMDRQLLWDAVQAKETRKNSQLAREIIVALPHELSAAEGAELVKEWVRDTFVDIGMIADVAVHDPHRKDNSSNRHAHVMLTTRELDDTQPDGWAKKKARAWNDTALLERWRASWADAQNAAFEERGLSVRVDHRTLEDQKATAEAIGDDIGALVLSRDPEPRLGLAAGALEAKGITTERGEALRAAREHRAALMALAGNARAADAAVSAAMVDIPLLDPFAPPPSDPFSEIEETTDMDRTKIAVERQLKGMGLDQLEVSITGGDRPNVRTMTPTDILNDLPRLKRANKAGCNIYVRGPRDIDHDLILLDDIALFTPRRMAEDGLKPAVVIETSPGNCQAWIRLGEPTPADVRHEAAKILADRYDGDTAAVAAHQSGRLAGFTNQKPEHKKSGRSPFVILHSYAGKAIKAARDLIETAKSALVVRKAETAAALALIPSPNADADLVQWFEDGHAATKSADLSGVDWHLTHLALGSGRTPEDVAAALEVSADRKGKHAHSYATQTVQNAISVRLDYTPTPDSDDLPSPS